MCGRYTLTSFDNLQAELDLAMAPALAAPRYNIAPGQMVPVVQNRPERTLSTVRWGLVPYWADDPRIGNRMINARCESVADKPAFRHALSRRRCLVVADGFYEWQRPASETGAASSTGRGRSQGRGGTKVPYYIHRRSGAPFGMAGLWERWKAPDGNWLETCTILTCDANPLMAPLHARMPLILDRASYDLWLDPEPLPPEALTPPFRAPPVGDFEAYPVSTLVNAPQHDDPACVVPASGPSAGPASEPAPARAAEGERSPRQTRETRARSARDAARREAQPSLFDPKP
jgi:putative SOS response-associated peptidase YedK